MYLDVTDDGNVLHEKLMLIFYPLILSLFIFLFFYSRLSCVCTGEHSHSTNYTTFLSMYAVA